MSYAGTNVRTVRQQLGMSLRAVADAADIDPATLSRIENGKTQLTGDLAQKLSKALHVSAAMFFADPGTIEVAMLRMRKAPLLTPAALLTWRGPDTFEEAPDQEYLHTSLKVATRQVFALSVEDDANHPVIRVGDTLLFDAGRAPKRGDYVATQNAEGATFLGQYRPSNSKSRPTAFDLISANRLYPDAPSDELGLVLRGVLVEQRRYF